jgi:hypothetical protein
MIFLANLAQIRNGITKLFAKSGKPQTQVFVAIAFSEQTKKCPANSDGAL